MNLKPIGDRVIIQLLKEEEVTPSGIVLPDTIDKEKKAEGKIIAIGQGDKVKALGLNVGDKVLFGKYAGDEVTVDKQDYKILTHEDVLAVFSE